ncbi:PAS domain-containing protein [Paenibacillus albiflavus]|uniref:histidine kinase n=1 Tax=Paenibacillus albiflavus TaxID=2545760 RepID=A0A4R4EHW1_9BACL|nr:ATP-binding protein [Paenibacillus albiflavus]TCZ78943.1 PAS domain-containing protein [Paenibacillus albiflavus]
MTDKNWTETWLDIDNHWNLYFMFPMVFVDLIHAETLYNHSFVALTGYTSEQLVHKPLDGIVSFDVPISEIYEHSYPNPPSFTMESSRIAYATTATNQKIPMEYFVVKMKTRPQSYVIVFRQMEEVAQSLFQRFSKTFLQDVNLGVILINADYRLVEISDMACKILGLDKEETVGKPVEDVFANVPLEYQLVQRTLLDGIIVRNHAVSWTNGQKRYDLLLDSNVLREEDGRIVGAYLFFKDVTNLRSLEEQVQRSDRLSMIGQIAAGTAHEIRNPLTSIKGFLQLFRNSFEGRGMVREQGYVDLMLTEITRVNEMLNEFLMLSKPKHAKYKQTNISHVLLNILPIIQGEAILHQVMLHYNSHPDLPLVVADQEMLKQVFLNICKNGIEAMNDGGGTLTVTEKVDIEDRYVWIEIHDTGPGIPIYVMDKIFDPFFTTKDDATGLGLSVCQRIIHEIGGNIRVSSKGFGTTFTICIPYQ